MKLYTDKVVKIYRSRTVVKEVSVEVSQGEIVGLLGPNGAGKTTTFYMVVGIIKPFSGRVFFETTCEEDKQNPLTDEQLVAVLAEHGYPIARRTIAKYREQLDIPVARLRKAL